MGPVSRSSRSTSTRPRGVAAKYGVLSIPTLMIFHGGQVKDQYMGLLSKKALADRVDKVL